MITPDYIHQLINFYPDITSNHWQFDLNANDMRNQQIKGSAHIYNLLERHKIALLADEVGMGKTIQSLAVISALLQKKPNAKILILVPRDEIVKNWEKEYRTFIRYHYRHHDNIIKSAIGSEPVRKLIYCPNLYHLTHQVQQGWGQLFIGKISSFSNLLSKKDVLKSMEDLSIRSISRLKELTQKEEINNEVARLLRNEILRFSYDNKPYFDLVVIDEAHYFRKKDGESLRVNSAIHFFGDPVADVNKKLVDKVLLLTATPNHSSSNDISNIVSYFTSKFNNNEYKEILDTICVRRLRRLSSESLNKYNYRHEIESQSNFQHNPLSESFFALYQHELAKKVNQQKGKSQGGISRMMKYLEGVEFIPNNENIVNEGIPENQLTADFSNGEDAEILSILTKKYNEIFNTHPNHPKYDKLINDLTEKHSNEKALVFVRRIPSVYEISRRVIEYYDRRMWQVIQKNELSTLSYEKLNRRTFNSYKKAFIAEDIEEENEIQNESELKLGLPESKVLNLFKIIKNDSVVRTNAANFRLRFNASKPSIYALFFSPGADYYDLPYSELISYRFDEGSKQIDNYFLSAFKFRSDLISDTLVSKDIQSVIMPKQPIVDNGVHRQGIIETLFTIFWDVLSKDETIDLKEKTKIRNIYLSLNYYEREALSKFIEKGTLLASEGLLWFYSIFLNIKEQSSQIDQYIAFTHEVKNVLSKIRLYNQIIDCIKNFKSIYSKVFGISNDKSLLEFSWDNFNNAQPIYPYSADNSSKNVLNSFNTPFFPDILVATSVLQEGVNLQYFCKNIYHYGMAWTPGDNEQRIGRIDRMFSKIERDIDSNKISSLPIYYPYLKDTIDEDHLSKFIKRKYREEELIDLGRVFKDSGEYLLEDNQNDNWRDYLRKPSDKNINDPYPVNIDSFKNIKSNDYSPKNISFSALHHSIINTITEFSEYSPKAYYIDYIEKPTIIIDPLLKTNRSQPVIIETVFDPIGTGYIGEAVYCLRMKTPVAPLNKLKYLRKNFYSNQEIEAAYLPGIKLCMDIQQEGGSPWGIYMCAELPLFLKDVEINYLSVQEVQHAFINLIECADLTEQKIFNNQDLHLNELNLPIHSSKKIENLGLRRSKKTIYTPNWKQDGDYYILEMNRPYDDFDMEKQSMIDNHKKLYVKNAKKNNQWILQASYLVHDVQEKEILLLEKHIRVVYNNWTK
jgi:superfamily II DNA or RNA helicase